MDAPAFRIWPPVALGVPLATGLVLTWTAGDPVSITGAATRWTGWGLVALVALWNGWAMAVMLSRRTGVLPGQASTTLLESGPFRFSRNPLYVGLVTLDVGLALVATSFWALVLVPVGVAALVWGAVLPEERYLSATFGAEYDAYRARVRRWV